MPAADAVYVPGAATSVRGRALGDSLPGESTQPGQAVTSDLAPIARWLPAHRVIDDLPFALLPVAGGKTASAWARMDAALDDHLAPGKPGVLGDEAPADDARELRSELLLAAGDGDARLARLGRRAILR
jgi:hypothetical protein